jgi:hypothetical protein
MLNIKLKGGALYVSVIISILISIILSLFIVIAHFNVRSVSAQNNLQQLNLSLTSGFDIAQSEYYLATNSLAWQKMPYNNDSVMVKKMAWGCYTLVDVKAKNTHFNLHKTGLFGCLASKDTALFVSDQNRPIGLAGKIKFNSFCYLSKAGIKSAYIEGKSFSDLNSLKPFIKLSSATLPQIDELYLKQIDLLQHALNPLIDSLVSYIPESLNQSFQKKTAVIQQGSITLRSQMLSNNIKIIASNQVVIENTCQLNNVLIIARKITFKKGFQGTVHVIARDSIVTEEECVFKYPSSFCVYNNQNKIVSNSKISNQPIRGIFFGENCKFNGGLLAINDKSESSKLMIKVNKHFELIGNLYSSDYTDAQGNLYGSVFCKSLLLQTPSAVYENHIMNSLFDSKKYSKSLVIPIWFKTSKQQQLCAKWF